MIKTLLFLVTAALGTAALGVADAAAQTTYNGTSTIAFDRGLTVTPVSQINFGEVKALTADNYTISTAGVLSHTGSGAFEGGTTAVGHLTISGSTTQGITISVSNYVANNGVTPSNAKGKYGAGVESAFPISGAAPGAGTALLLGVTVAPNGTQADNTTANPTFDVSVVYQ